jgi:hypothetical protein
LGRIAAHLPQIRNGPTHFLLSISVISARTHARLCDRKKFAKVRVRTASLSQFVVANPAQGLQHKQVPRRLK